MNDLIKHLAGQINMQLVDGTVITINLPVIECSQNVSVSDVKELLMGLGKKSNKPKQDTDGKPRLLFGDDYE